MTAKDGAPWGVESDRESARLLSVAPRLPTRVIKLGGRTHTDARLVDAIAAAARSSRLVIVHGGGDELSALQRRLGIVPVFRNGRRVTTGEDLELARMVLSGSANKRLVASLGAAGVRAVGISGEDGPTLFATPLDAERLGAVGTPSGVNVALLDDLLDAGWIPVVSPLARDATSAAGDALNVNGDDAAAAIASALGASELLLVADVPGVLDGQTVIPTLDAGTTRELVAAGKASAGMIAKLEAAHAALDGGVARVRVGDVTAIADLTRGTVVEADTR